jgi:hypothetical protein
MALKDTIETEVIAPVATIEEAPAAPVEPEIVVADTPEPQVHQAPVSPILQMAIDQAAYRLARETAE